MTIKRMPVPTLEPVSLEAIGVRRSLADLRWSLQRWQRQ